MTRHDATEFGYERLLAENRPSAKLAVGMVQILRMKRSHCVFREYGLNLHLKDAPFLLSRSIVQIPTEGGHLFRFESGHRSDLNPATIPI